MLLTPRSSLVLGYLCTATLLGFWPIPLCAQGSPEPGDLVVNELLYNQSATRTEFIELYNRSGKTIDLRNVTFSDNRRAPKPITTAERLLPPSGYAVLVDDGELFRNAFPEVDFIAPPRWDGLNNSGDAVILYHQDTEIERVAYTPSWGGGDGISLERIDPSSPSDSPSNFGSSTDPAGATPGRVNSIFAPDTEPPALLFAEQTAPREADLYVSEPLDPASLLPSRFLLDDGRSPQTAELFGNDTRVHLTFAEALSGLHITAAGLRDRTGNVLDDAETDLAFTAHPGDLSFNELMFDPLADAFDNRPNQPEYFELINRTNRPLSLRHLFWTDQPDETGAADTIRFGSRFASVIPDGYAVVFAAFDSADAPAQNSTLARAFAALDFTAPSVTLVPIEAQSLGLLNSGDLIRLHRPDGAVLTQLRYDPDWHAPSLVATKGIALERISLTAPLDEPNNWTSSVAPSGGTPGLPNSVFLSPDAAPETSDVVITPSPFSPDNDGIDDVTTIRYRFDGNVALVRVRIFDARGHEVYTEDADLVSRQGEMIWDGRDHDGNALRLGIYVVLVEAVNTNGGTVQTSKTPVVLARPLR